jgi:hypothetical protein
MIIEVQRGLGDIDGDPITEPMLSDEMLLVRGKAEMNAHAHPIVHHNLDVIYRDGLRLGQLVSVSDPATAESYKAKITGIRIRYIRGQIEANIQCEQPQ